MLVGLSGQKKVKNQKDNMDTKVFKNLSIFGKLHTNFILVALNISRPIETPFWKFSSELF